MDAVYDRGALEAINVADRQGYVKLMQSLLGKEFRLEENLLAALIGIHEIFSQICFECLRV